MANIIKPALISIILVESALERIDFLQRKKNQFKKYEKKQKKPLEKRILDVSIHNHLIQKIPEKIKRGRPDIIHRALLLALDSRLNQEGYLRIYVHTRNDEVITFKPEVRIPRNYNRFIGLIEQLFEVKKIPPNAEQTLISIKSQKIEDLINKLYPDRVILFSEKGIPTNDEKLQKIFSRNKNIIILIGGFPHGDFSEKILVLADEIFSIYDKSLTTLSVLSTVIQSAERKWLKNRIETE